MEGKQAPGEHWKQGRTKNWVGWGFNEALNAQQGFAILWEAPEWGEMTLTHIINTRHTFFDSGLDKPSYKGCSAASPA